MGNLNFFAGFYCTKKPMCMQMGDRVTISPFFSVGSWRIFSAFPYSWRIDRIGNLLAMNFRERG